MSGARYPSLYAGQKGAGVNVAETEVETKMEKIDITKGNDPYEESKVHIPEIISLIFETHEAVPLFNLDMNGYFAKFLLRVYHLCYVYDYHILLLLVSLPLSRF